MSFLGQYRIRDTGSVGAFVIAVASTAGLVALGLMAFSAIVTDYPGGVISLSVVFLFIFLVAAVVIAVAGLLVALPVTWILSRNAMEPPGIYPLIGVLSGGLIILLLAWLLGARDQAEFLYFLRYAPIGAIPGGVFGALWWYFRGKYVRDA